MKKNYLSPEIETIEVRAAIAILKDSFADKSIDDGGGGSMFGGGSAPKRRPF